MRIVRTTSVVVILLTLLGGCEREEGITLYQAPKDPVAPVAAVSEAPVGAPAQSAGQSSGPLEWVVPDGWKPLPAQQMRFAAYAVNDANPPVEMTVIPLGPEAGEILANVNRWEGQLGLPHTPKEKLGEVVKHSHAGDLEVDSVDLTSLDKKQRMLAAIVPHGGQIWFFKMTGPADVVSAQQEKFDGFVASLKPGAGSGAPLAMTGPKDQQVARETVSEIKTFAAPAGWTEIPDSKPPRVLAFKADAAEMVVTRFAPGNTGTFIDNVNRWRMQLGLGPVEDPKSTKMQDIKVGKEGEAILVEIENPDSQPPKKTLVAIAGAQQDLWFFKFSGPSDAVNKERAAFEQFLASVEFGADEGDAK